MLKCKIKAIVKAQGTCIIIFVEVNDVNDYLHIVGLFNIAAQIRKHEDVFYQY